MRNPLHPSLLAPLVAGWLSFPVLAYPVLAQSHALPSAATARAAPPVAELAEPPAAVSDAGQAAQIWIVEGDQPRRLDSFPGTLGRTWAYWVTLFWADFPGLHAELRVQEPRPVFRVAMEKTPRHRLFLVRCRTNRGDRNRSVKMGQAGVFTYKGLQAPDSDWVIPTEVREERPGVWRVVPLEPLAPGEYGFFSGAAGAQATKGSPAGELFEFGVDRPGAAGGGARGRE